MDLSFLLYYKPPCLTFGWICNPPAFNIQLLMNLQSTGISNAFNALYFLSRSTCTCGRIANPPERKRMFINNLQS